MAVTKVYEPSLDEDKKEGKDGTKEVFNYLFNARKDLDLSDKIIEELVHGLIDFHIHAAPDASSNRIYDEEDVAIRACDAGMKAVVFKCHSMPSSSVAVGIPVAQYPPHRSGLEELPHPAPALGNNAKAH